MSEERPEAADLNSAEREPGPPIPPDPAAYDHPRAVHARARGLAAPYIPGGRDPEPERAAAEERRWLRLLVAMVVLIILSGYVLGVLANLIRGV